MADKIDNSNSKDIGCDVLLEIVGAVAESCKCYNNGKMAEKDAKLENAVKVYKNFRDNGGSPYFSEQMEGTLYAAAECIDIDLGKLEGMLK